jgi:hypothetical protein
MPRGSSRRPGPSSRYDEGAPAGNLGHDGRNCVWYDDDGSVVDRWRFLSHADEPGIVG